MKHYLLIVCFAVTLSCDGESPTLVVQTPGLETLNQLEARASQIYGDVIAEIKAFLDPLPTCSDEPSEGKDWCQMVKVGFTPKEPKAASLGQRILIIDSGMRLAAYTRYKSRVFEFLSSDENGTFRPYAEEIELPRGKLHVLSHILDEKHPDTPAVALKSIVRMQYERPIFRASNYGPEHGDRIFGTLADLNPQAEFLIAVRVRLPEERLQKALSETEFFAILGNYLDNSVLSLSDAIRKFNINFVNMSHGHSLDDLNGLSYTFPLIMPLADFNKRVVKFIKERYYDRLFALEDVVFVQAAAPSNDWIAEGNPDFLSDCTSYPNRIRAGALEFKSTDVPKEGARRAQYLHDQKAQACTDIFFNSGVILNADLEPDRGEFPYMSTFDGIGLSYPDDQFSSSWAAPFVLSFLNFKKQEAKRRGEDFSLAPLHNSQMIIEPIKFKQVELFHTGGLK